ncbi:MAG: transcriptional regulator [Methylovulum sp.]|nr:transcriptional regulator [Methylovulum sp.]
MNEEHTRQDAPLLYSYERFAQAKLFMFRKWCELAAERQRTRPTDLSGSCKYGSLFMKRVFGGTIRGHYEHQYNVIDGRIVDLSHDAKDVGRICNPYLHEPEYFTLPEKHVALNACLPRVNDWAMQFLTELELLDAKASKQNQEPR